MTKQRRYQGTLPTGIATVVFMVLGLCCFVYYLFHFGANQLSAQGKILDSQTTSGNVAAQVIYIYPKSRPIEENGTELYLIGYADKDNQIGYIGLEAKKNDRLIRRLYKDNETLIDKPYRLEVVVLSADNYLTDKSLATLSKGLLKSNSTLGHEMDKVRLVSLSLAKANRNRFYLMSMVLLLLGVVSAALTYRQIARNQKALETFYDLYPEMDASLSKAKTYAHFAMNDYDLLVYQDHLLTYGKDIRLLDLRDVSILKQTKKTVRQGNDIVELTLPVLLVEFSEAKKQTIRLKKIIPMDLQALWVYLNRYFTHIQTDAVPANQITTDEVVLDLEDLEW